MIKTLGYTVFLFSLISFCVSCSFTHSHSVKPNVIIVLTDDQGWGDVAYNGNEIINTPNLDSLAKEAVVFNRFYVSPVCAPTRASLLTGKYHLATGTSWVTHRKEVMRETEETMAETLVKNGYATACFGKWHNGQQYPHNAMGQGFEKFFGFSAGHWNNYFNTTLEYNGKSVETQGYISNVLTDSLNAFIENTTKPFFALVAYNTPHTPYQVPDSYYEKYLAKGIDKKTAAIYGMCENIDDNVKRIQNALKKSNKHNNTIFIYLSDNGPNYVRYNGGYRGRKARVDEGGVRVPFILNYPNGKLQNRQLNNDFAAHIDLFPTILELCGIDNTHDFSGKSFVKILKDSTQHLTDRMFFSHQIFNANEFATSVRTNNYLLTCYPNDTSLYNLATDPYQIKNIIADEPVMADSLKESVAEWLAQYKPDMLIPEPIQIGHNCAKNVEFPAHEAILSKSLKFNGGAGWANDWVIGFSSKSDTLSWAAKVVAKGIYKVNLSYVGAVNSSGASFKLLYPNGQTQFKINKAVAKKRIEMPDRVARVEADELEWGTQEIANIQLPVGAALLSVAYNDSIVSDVEIKGIEIYKIN